MTTIFMVEHSNNNKHEAFTSKVGALARILELVREGFENSGLSEEDCGIDIERLSGHYSTPDDWEELSVQWNEFWEGESDMWILLYEIPLN